MLPFVVLDGEAGLSCKHFILHISLRVLLLRCCHSVNFFIVASTALRCARALAGCLCCGLRRRSRCLCDVRLRARSAGGAYSVTLTSDQGALRVPKSYRQAMSSPQAEQWREAIAKELAGLVALKTWDLVPLASVPASANVMHCHFVFAIKRKADGSIDKFKARLVADGSTQKHWVDFNRVFATVVKALTIRLVLAIAAARDYNLTSLDIRQAYLQATIDEDLYMRAPPGVNNRGGELVCKLRRSLYGLKQAGREWAQLLSSFLVSWGFVRSTIDVCLYTYEKDGTVLAQNHRYHATEDPCGLSRTPKIMP